MKICVTRIQCPGPLHASSKPCGRRGRAPLGDSERPGGKRCHAIQPGCIPTRAAQAEGGGRVPTHVRRAARASRPEVPPVTTTYDGLPDVVGPPDGTRHAPARLRRFRLPPGQVVVGVALPLRWAAASCRTPEELAIRSPVGRVSGRSDVSVGARARGSPGSCGPCVPGRVCYNASFCHELDRFALKERLRCRSRRHTRESPNECG